MYQEERLVKILKYLNEHNTMSIHCICDLLQVSRDTARRDILKLIEQKVAMRTHGGISLPSLQDTIKEYRQRIQSYSEEKKLIAQKALEFIKESNHYFFDVSTIIRFLAEEIHTNIWVFTHSLDNIEILSEKSEVNSSLLGGCLHHKNRFFYKPDCRNYFADLRFDIAFLGAAAIAMDGIYYVDEEDAFIKKSVVDKAAKVILLAEYDKFKCSSYYKGITWEQIDVVITNQMPPARFVEVMQANDIECIIA